MKNRIAMLILGGVLAVLVSQTNVRAHSGGEHIQGKVAAVHESSLDVDAADGKRVTVKLDAATKFEKSGAPAGAKDLRSGEKVIVHAKKTDAGLVAEHVKFGKTPAKKDGDGHEHHGGDPGHGEQKHEGHDGHPHDGK